MGSIPTPTAKKNYMKYTKEQRESDLRMNNFHLAVLKAEEKFNLTDTEFIFSLQSMATRRVERYLVEERKDKPTAGDGTPLLRERT